MFPKDSLRKVGILTAFSTALAVVAYGGEAWFPGRFFRFHEWVAGIGVCWLSDSLSILWVDAERRRSPDGVAGVWIGTLPRLGGPMLAVVVATVWGDPKEAPGLVACLVFVYLVSLPVAVWLTLPEVDRKIEKPAGIGSEADSEGEDP